jgi:FKBP-type peptidyl-prolyl cis-trans isomerase
MQNCFQRLSLATVSLGTVALLALTVSIPVRAEDGAEAPAEAKAVEKSTETTEKVEKKTEKKAEKKAAPKKAAGGKRQPKKGMEYEVITVGKGKVAKDNDQVSVHYEGKLENGTVFDSSKKRGEPFTFLLGAKQVISGWDVGVEGMKEGEKRMLYIPSEMAYGERGVPGVIPPKSKLIFEVELLKVAGK